MSADMDSDKNKKTPQVEPAAAPKAQPKPKQTSRTVPAKLEKAPAFPRRRVWPD